MNVTCFGASTVWRLYTCLAILLVTGHSSAQTPGNQASFRHLTTEDGLSGNRVRSFCHDRRGFLWIGAEDGLNRYDGKHCVAFRPAPGRAGALSGNTIPALLEDSRGNFWIGSNAGLQLLDQATGTFFPNSGDENPLRDIGHVLALKEDQNGHIWVGTTQGLFQLNVEPKRTFSPETFREARLPVRHFSHNPNDTFSLSHNHVWCIETDREGQVWVGTGRGLNRFDPKSGTFARAPLPAVSNAHLLTNVAVSALLHDHAGNLWAGTKKGLYRVSPDRKTLRDLGDERYLQTGITRIMEDAQHHVWVGSDGGGLFRWAPNSDVPIRFSNEPDDPKSLKNNNIGALFADRDGGLWVGHHRGVSYRSRYQKPVAQYRATGQKNALAANNITSLFADADGFVWMGNDGSGLGLLNRKTGIVYTINLGLGDFSGSTAGKVMAVRQDQTGVLWIGTWGQGLMRLNPKANKAFAGKPSAQFMPDGKPGSIGDDDIVHLFEDSRGMLWIGTAADGLNGYDPATNTFRAIPRTPQNTGSLFKNWVFDICEDRQGNLWVATIDGISRLLRDPERFEDYPIERTSKTDRINAMHPDQSGRFWLATDEGLLLFDPKKKTIQKWQQQAGLADNKLTCIVEDARGNLWMGGPRGISKFNPETRTFRVYDARDGLLGGAFTTAFADPRTGELYFAGPNGLNIFHPDSMSDNPTPPPVVITGLKLFNRPMPVRGTAGDTLDFASPLQREIFCTDEVRLAYWQNDFAFEFAALNYLNPEKNRCKYRLECYRSNWVEAEAGQNVAQYTNLSPGTYTFSVIGSNNDGVWNTSGATVRVIIAPPWWRTWWAYLLYALVLAGLVFWFWRKEMREQALQHRLELERLQLEQFKEMDKTKTRLYANITHEFRTPLTVILGMAEQIEKQPQSRLREGLGLIRRNGRNLLALINQMLDLAKLESNRMPVHLVQGDIVAYTKYVAESFHSNADARDIQLDIGSEPEAIVMDYDPGIMQQIVSNLLSNALKFTPPGGVVRVFIMHHAFIIHHSSFIILKVADTGIGIPPEQLPHIFERFYQADNSSTRQGEGTGIGLALTLELVRLLGGTISVESTPGQGTAFAVQLPITRNAEQTAGATGLPALPQNAGGIPDVADDTLRATGTEDGPLLLLVEDNADVRAFVVQCLEQEYRIETAANGKIGIEKALERVPDIIISDVMMPEKDGFELCDTLKNDARTSHIPIVLLTARAAVEDRITGLERGADAYIAKPFHQGELLVQLQNLLDSRRRLQERYRTISMPVEAAAPDEIIEDAFLLTFRALIEAELDNTNLSIDDICRRMAMSRMQLHRKIKALTGRSTTLHIRGIRLQRALHLLRTTDRNVSEVAYQVGFSDPAYFSRVFTEEFGVAPSAVRD